MKVNILKLTESHLPDSLRTIAQPPAQIYWRGVFPPEILNRPKVAIVGSRKATTYGRRVTVDLTSKLARSGVVIISGLAFGIDSIAHISALEAGGCTVAVLPSPIEKVYPASHHNLAERIINGGGALVSEYENGTDVYKHSFIARNRLISGLADVLVITEAARNSGSLHTASFALEQGKTVMAVPGDINSPFSEGCNNLIKSGGIPLTGAEDIFFALNINPQDTKAIVTPEGTPEQRIVFELIAAGIQDQEQLANRANLGPSDISSTLTMLELHGYIRPVGAGQWVVS